MSAIDIALSDGTEDLEYLRALEAALPRVFEFGPEIIFYQSGVDALASDRLGRLRLTHDGLATRDRIVFAACARAEVPCVVRSEEAMVIRSRPRSPRTQRRSGRLRICCRSRTQTEAYTQPAGVRVR